MPIEIRELIIKTEVRTTDLNTQNTIKSEDLLLLKSQLLEDCKRMLTEGNKRASYKR